MLLLDDLFVSDQFNWYSTFNYFLVFILKLFEKLLKAVATILKKLKALIDQTKSLIKRFQVLIWKQNLLKTAVVMRLYKIQKFLDLNELLLSLYKIIA